MLLQIGGEDQSFKHESCGDWFQNLHTSNQSKEEEEEASKSCSKWRTIPSISFTCTWVSPGLRPRLSSLVLGHPQFLLHQSHFWSRPYPPPHLGISHLISVVDSKYFDFASFLTCFLLWIFFFYVCRSLKPRLWSLFIVGFERIRKNARWVVLFYFIFLIFLVYGCLVAGKRKIKRKVGFGIYGCLCVLFIGDGNLGIDTIEILGCMKL